MRKSDLRYARWMMIRYLPWFAFLVVGLIGLGLWGLDRSPKSYQSTARVFFPLSSLAESRPEEWVDSQYFNFERKVRQGVPDQILTQGKLTLIRDTPQSLLIDVRADTPNLAYTIASEVTVAVVATARDVLVSLARSETRVQQEALEAAQDRLMFQAVQLSKTQAQFAKVASGPLDRYIGQRDALLAQLNNSEEPLDVFAPVIANIEALSDSLVDNPQAHAAIKAQQAFFELARSELVEASARLKRATLNEERVASQGEAPVRIIDMASVPQSPMGVPNKPLILTLFILALTLALIRLHAMRDQTVRRPRDIEQSLGVPVFGTIPELVTSAK